MQTDLKSGSQEHLESFTNDKLKNFYENLWDQEITVLIAQDALRKKQDKLHQVEARLSETQDKVFSSHKEAKQAIKEIEDEKKSVEADINALTNLIIRDTQNITDHKSIIEKTQQWAKDNQPSGE
jgi:hypothetical protein